MDDIDNSERKCPLCEEPYLHTRISGNYKFYVHKLNEQGEEEAFCRVDLNGPIPEYLKKLFREAKGQ